MRFKLWLEHYNKENWHSWLNPQGEFFPVPRGETHYECIKSMFPTMLDAYKHGWFRITYFGGYGEITLYADNESTNLNSIQKRNLINLAIETGITSIEQDAGKNVWKIWSKVDQI